MPFATTAPLRREIAARIPERPFTVAFWDGTELAATDGAGDERLAKSCVFHQASLRFPPYSHRE